MLLRSPVGHGATSIEQNEPDGYDVAVAKEIFKRLGVAKVEIVADKFANFVESLITVKYDLVVSGMADTPDRAKKLILPFRTACRTFGYG